jgi:hypothetical protein
MSGKGAKGLSGKGLSGKGAKGTMSSKKGDKRKPTSRSVKAGLQFPVGRIHRFLKVNFCFVTVCSSTTTAAYRCYRCYLSFTASRRDPTVYF